MVLDLGLPEEEGEGDGEEEGEGEEDEEDEDGEGEEEKDGEGDGEGVASGTFEMLEEETTVEEGELLMELSVTDESLGWFSPPTAKAAKAL